MTEAEFMACLRTKHEPREFALFPQVRNGTGGFGRRTADAIAVSLWPSRGIDAHGFEFKDSRTDWLKELKNSEKSDEVGRYCAFWWLVVSDPAIFSVDELPAAWGAMHATEGTVKVLRKAPRRDTQPLTWTFVAAVLRAAAEHVSDSREVQMLVRDAERKARDQEQKNAERLAISRVKAATEGRDRLQRIIDEFEESSGLTLSDWKRGHNAKLGAVVKVLLGGHYRSRKDDFEQMAKHHRQLAEEAEAAARELAALMSPNEPQPVTEEH